MKHFFLFLLIIAFFSSCKKQEPLSYDPNIKAPLTLEFDQVVGGSDLVLDTETYTNAAGEDFTVTQLKYFISNIKLTRTDGTEYVVPQDECYFLIDESDEATHEAALNIPEGEYKTLQFMVGVDSLRSTMDAGHRTGVLDPSGAASGMYWGANEGYIFFNLEGHSTASPGHIFSYHIGGYGHAVAPAVNNIKTVTIDLTAHGIPRVKAGKMTNIHLFADLLKLFNANSVISISSHPEVAFDPFSLPVANNYMSMFSHMHTEN